MYVNIYIDMSLYICMYIYVSFPYSHFFRFFFLISEYVDLHEGFQVETYDIKSMINQ